MRIEDSDDFKELLGQVMAYYGKDASPFIAGVFWDALKGHDLADIRRAFGLHAQDAEKGMFAPKVADVLRYIEGTGGDRAQRAWASVAAAIRCAGPYQTVAFDDPLIHVVIEEMGGWIKLCDVESKDMPFRANEFCTRYRSYSVRRMLPPHLPKLCGVVEADCKARNLADHIPAPVLIGNPERARLTMQSGSATAGALQLTVADGVDTALAAIANRRAAA